MIYIYRHKRNELQVYNRLIMQNTLKKVGLGILVLLVVIQFIRPEKNIQTAKATHHISKLYPVPVAVEATLIKACYDCHSNNTYYPWYNNLQPVAWWLNHHVDEGKHEINFDEFASYRIAKQYKKMHECIEEVEEGEMPLNSYTWIHKNAILTNEEKTTLVSWFKSIQDSIKANYPADSLVLPKKKKA